MELVGKAEGWKVVNTVFCAELASVVGDLFTNTVDCCGNVNTGFCTISLVNCTVAGTGSEETGLCSTGPEKPGFTNTGLWKSRLASWSSGSLGRRSAGRGSGGRILESGWRNPWSRGREGGGGWRNLGLRLLCLELRKLFL